MQSPDLFASDDDSKDSFDTFMETSGVSRKRSQAIVTTNEDSFDIFTGTNQQDDSIIENPETNETILMEEEEKLDLNDTITLRLESSGDDGEQEEPDPVYNDALSSLLKSFARGETEKKKTEDEKEEEQPADLSVDIFDALSRDNDDNQKPEQVMEVDDDLGPSSSNKSVEMADLSFDIFDALSCDNVAPVDTPIAPTPSRKRPTLCEPSTSTATSSGPTGIISTNTKKPQNQQKSVDIHGNSHVINSFGDYMRVKMAKLNQQVNIEQSKPMEKISDILKGYSVFVNGFTDPPALVIRDLMIAHGGEYHCYYEHGITTFNIASTLASAKINRIREKEIFIKVDWITESIAAGKPLDYRDFLIYEKGAQEKGRMRQFLTAGSATSSSPPNNVIDARNPNFIRDYYARSRLHLISTLAQDMKDFVANLKIEGKLAKKCFDEQELRALGRKDSFSFLPNTVFHVDLDCFFVSVAVREREELREKEVAITHSKGTSSNSMSEIASCSYAARRCGVKNGMLVRDALQHCPQLTLLPYQFDDYVQVSKQIYQILASYTLELRAVSCDEMYINVGDICMKYGINDPTLLAEHIRRVIRRETRCPASVGIGSTSLLARLATRHAKPDGVYWVKEDQKHGFMKEEKVRDLPGLGYEMMSRLSQCYEGLTKCGQLQLKDERDLARILGPKLAAKLFKQCRGLEEDAPDFWKTQVRKSVSCDINYGIRFSKREELVQLMTAIGAELERKLTDCKMSAGSVTLKLMVRSANAPLETAKFMGHGMCDTFTKTANLSVPTTRGDTLTAEGMKLFSKVSPKIGDLRGVGVTCAKLTTKQRKDATTAVLEMFGKKKKKSKKKTRKKEPKKPEKQSKEKERDEDDMRGQIISYAPTRPIRVKEKKKKVVLHASQMTYQDGRSLPGILTQSERQIRKALKVVEAEKVDGEELRRKYEGRLEKIMKKAPTETNVLLIREMMSILLHSGKLCTFEHLYKAFEYLSTDSRKSHVDWFATFHIMSPSIQKESKDLLEYVIDISIERAPKSAPLRVQKDPTVKKVIRVPREVFVQDTTRN